MASRSPVVMPAIHRRIHKKLFPDRQNRRPDQQNEGKSGSARVCYVDFVVQEVIYLITVYSKNEKENLSQAERNGIKSLIEQLKLKL